MFNKKIYLEFNHVNVTDHCTSHRPRNLCVSDLASFKSQVESSYMVKILSEEQQSSDCSQPESMSPPFHLE